ncbi:hypothetical protein [Sphingobacterium hungaricum]
MKKQILKSIMPLLAVVIAGTSYALMSFSVSNKTEELHWFVKDESSGIYVDYGVSDVPPTSCEELPGDICAKGFNPSKPIPIEVNDDTTADENLFRQPL